MASTRRRLNLIIDAELMEQLQKVAREKELSVSWLVRKGVKLLLDAAAVEDDTPRRRTEMASKRKSPLDDPILKVIGLFEGPTSSSRAMDDDLYKAKRR